MGISDTLPPFSFVNIEEVFYAQGREIKKI